MSTHVQGLTVDELQFAYMRARTVDHSVELVDDATHTIVTVTTRGLLVMRPEERP